MADIPTPMEIERRERQNLQRDYEKAHAEILRLRAGLRELALKAADMMSKDAKMGLAAFKGFVDELHALQDPPKEGG